MSTIPCLTVAKTVSACTAEDCFRFRIGHLSMFVPYLAINPVFSTLSPIAAVSGMLRMSAIPYPADDRIVQSSCVQALVSPRCHGLAYYTSVLCRNPERCSARYACGRSPKSKETVLFYRLHAQNQYRNQRCHGCDLDFIRCSGILFVLSCD